MDKKEQPEGDIFYCQCSAGLTSSLGSHESYNLTKNDFTSN